MTLFPTCTRSFLSSEDKTNQKNPKHLVECAVETTNTTASADGSHVCFSEQEQRGHSKRRVVAPLSTSGTFLQRCGLSLLLQVLSLKLSNSLCSLLQSSHAISRHHAHLCRADWQSSVPFYLESRSSAGSAQTLQKGRHRLWREPPPQQHCAHAGADAGGGHGASTGHCVLSSPTSMLRPEGAEHRYLSTNPYLPTNRWPDARKGHREEGSHRTQPAPRKKASGNAREAMRDESTRGRIP